jgi:N-methylhydantoinase A
VHAPRQAEELGIRRLLVPKTSPAFSALGLLIADYVVDRQRSYIAPSSRASHERVNELLELLEQDAQEELGPAGLGRDDLEFHRYVNLCYPGQTFDMAVPAVLHDGRMSAADLEATVAAFHDLHEELHAYAVRDEEPVLRAVRLHALGRTEPVELGESPAAAGPLADALRSRRPAFFGDRFEDTPVYDGDRIGAGHVIEGPAIVEERFTTIVVYPGQRAELDRFGNYVITLS